MKKFHVKIIQCHQFDNVVEFILDDTELTCKLVLEDGQRYVFGSHEIRDIRLIAEQAPGSSIYKER